MLTKYSNMINDRFQMEITSQSFWAVKKFQPSLHHVSRMWDRSTQQ